MGHQHHEKNRSASTSPGVLFMFRLRGTVITKIWWKVLLILIYTAALAGMHNYVDGMRMNFPQTLIPVLGVVTGLLAAFRTNTAYDRYWEGRKIWSTMTQAIRTLTRCIWVNVCESPKQKEGDEPLSENHQSEILLEKVSAINLLKAFAVSTKHYLRDEYEYDQSDLTELIGHLPKFCTPSSNQPLDSQLSPKVRKERKSERPTRCPTASQREKLTAHDCVTPTNIPIEISFSIASYINSIRERGLVDSSTISTMNSAVNSLVECLTSFERILRTPIPLAYSVHLHHAMWIYLLALPYQLMGILNWWTIPAVGLASFTLLGILSIGWEIENPFGYDENDLPLNDFCEVIQRELTVIIGHQIPKPETWIFSPRNFPLQSITWTNTSPKSAEDLRHLDIAELRHLLATRASRDRETDFGDTVLKMIKTNRSRSRSRSGERNGDGTALF